MQKKNEKNNYGDIIYYKNHFYVCTVLLDGMREAKNIY